METSSIEGIYCTSQTFVRRVNTDIHRYLYDQIRKNKDFEQIKDLPDSYIAADGIETVHRNKIPLWLFGFLY